jgi:hypothetical protein
MKTWNKKSQTQNADRGNNSTKIHKINFVGPQLIWLLGYFYSMFLESPANSMVYNFSWSYGRNNLKSNMKRVSQHFTGGASMNLKVHSIIIYMDNKNAIYFLIKSTTLTQVSGVDPRRHEQGSRPPLNLLKCNRYLYVYTKILRMFLK